jgi:hypothetical protein
MPLRFITTDQLAQAIQRAGDAHGVYEEALNQGRDEEWPDWYAQHIEGEPDNTEPTAEASAVSFDSTSELAQALLRAEAAHATDEHAEPDWARWYAQYFQHEQAGAAMRS